MSRPLPLTLALLIATGSLHAGVLFPTAYTAIFSFTEDSTQVGSRMSLAWDGASYWSAAGGGSGGIRQARYGPDGSLAASLAPGIDFRSVFSDAAGNVYARAYNSRTIYQQVSPGVFTPLAGLMDGTLDPQAAVVLNSAGTEYMAMSGGRVYRWSRSGVFLSSVALQGFGASGGEGLYPNNRGLAAWNGYWLTFADQVLSAWDPSGQRVDTTTLQQAGMSADAGFSFSVANGMFFVEDGGVWRGYGTAPAMQPLSQGSEVPEPAAWLLGAAGIGAIAILRRRARRSS